MFPNDLKVHVEADTFFSYPDLSIVCEEPKRWNNCNDVITNPVVLIKVLLKKTQITTEGKSLSSNRSLLSLQDYILLSCMETAVEFYVKQPTGHGPYTRRAPRRKPSKLKASNFPVP